MGIWSFVYDPTRTDAGAAFFTGFWLPQMNAIPSSGVPGEPSGAGSLVVWDLNELVLAGGQAWEEAALRGFGHPLGSCWGLLPTEGRP